MSSYSKENLVKRQDITDIVSSVNVESNRITKIENGTTPVGKATESSESAHATSANTAATAENVNRLGNLQRFQAATKYEVGDICYRADLPTEAYLECIVSGITDSTSTNIEGIVTPVDKNPITYERDSLWTATDQVNIKSPSWLKIGINNTCYVIDTERNMNINNSSNWDDETYATPANRAGVDCYVYAIVKQNALHFILSTDVVAPAGYDSTNSRKVAGFHGLCLDVGTIGNHPLSGYVTGDILPASVWDLQHRPASDPEGMVYIEGLNLWVDIYLNSYSGTAAKKNLKLCSEFNGTIADGTSEEKFNGIKFEQTYGEQRKRLPYVNEFRVFALGSNQGSNMSSDPITAGGHTDSSGRRTISYYGVEDCCGVMWQYCANVYSDQSNLLELNEDNDVVIVSDSEIDAISVNKEEGYTSSDRSDATGYLYGPEYKAVAGCSWKEESKCVGSRATQWSVSTLTFDESYSARGVAEPSTPNDSTSIIKITSCESADNATLADTATEAIHAKNADTATKADSATTADTAIVATTAESCSGNAATATTANKASLAAMANALTNARTIELSGDISGLTTFDGSSNVTITTQLNSLSNLTATNLTVSGVLNIPGGKIWIE